MRGQPALHTHEPPSKCLLPQGFLGGKKQRQTLACLRLNNNPVIRAQKTWRCSMTQAEEFQIPYFPTSQARERCPWQAAILGETLLWMNYSSHAEPGTHCLQPKMLPSILEVQEDPPGSLAGQIKDGSIEGNGGKINTMFSGVPHALGYSHAG